MTKLKKLFASAFLAVASLTSIQNASAQEMKTSYFLDHNTYSYRINPALTPNTRFFMGIGVGNVNVAAHSNLAATDLFVMDPDGTFVPGLDDNIPADQFLGGLDDKNKLNLNINENILGFGFRNSNGSFLTVDINLRSNTGFRVPRSFFEFSKELQIGKNYDIDFLGLNSRNYVELAVSYSRQLAPGLTFGAAVKPLFGIAALNLSLENVKIHLESEDELLVAGAGKLRGSLPVEPRLDENGNYDFDGMEYNHKPISGFGLGIDAGIGWRSASGLTLDAAILDLGGLVWKSIMAGDLDLGAVKAEGSEIEMEDAFNFQQIGTGGSFLGALPTTLNLGLKYRMPFANSLSVGAMGSFQFGKYSYNDLRLGLSFTPGRVLSLAASAGVTSCGPAVGAAINLHLGPINIFGGMDGMMVHFNSAGLPTDRLNTVAKLGLVIAVK